MHQHKSIVLQFVQCINDRNLEGLAALTADEFTFADASGRAHVWDREGAVRERWQGYFTPFPDYKLHVQQVLTGGEGVAIIGRTIGSHMRAEIEVDCRAQRWTGVGMARLCQRRVPLRMTRPTRSGHANSWTRWQDSVR